jgi:hypothetical protein
MYYESDQTEEDEKGRAFRSQEEKGKRIKYFGGNT